MPLTNLDFRLGDESLDLAAETEIQLEITSPLFETDTLPGTLVYPFTVPNTPKNRRMLGFPGFLAVAGVRNQLFVCDFYLLGVRWRRGQLSVVKRSVDGFELSFKTDVGDVSTQLTDVQLSALPWPTVPLVLTAGGAWPARAYALPSVANSLFVPEASVATLGYQGVVNAYAGGQYDTTQPVVPMPYLRTVLEQVAKFIGYSLAGTFFDDAELQALVLYANQAVDVATGLVPLAGQLPDVTVPSCLLAVRALLCQCWLFDPVRQVLTIDALRDVLASPAYVDWTDQAEAAFEWEPNVSAGYTLEQKLDGGDDLSKNAPADEYQLKIGGAKEVIQVDVSSLAMQAGPRTPTSTAPAILLPVTVQKGNTPALPAESDNKTTLRLLFDRGVQHDAAGNAYPLASAEAVAYSGASTGNYSLRWAGPKGLYQVWHQDWLAFRSRTELITRGIRLRVADLLTLDPRRKVLIRAAEGTTLAFWQQIQVTISQKDGIQVAQVPFYKI
ncbi:hypothetical protein [Hymenobacter baengnokdamensis]|uniref:hypothetical protein n=1 Tax=Hymenobacter baengnokdamensis TaxID=2615203 RepID=UPI0017859406|nr:hypothetical protein [Hymenobacter baengnokdamensis]